MVRTPRAGRSGPRGLAACAAESRNGVPDANAGIFVRCEFRSRTKSAENGGVGKIGMSIRRSFEMAVWFRSLQASQKVLRVAVGESERVKPLNFHTSHLDLVGPAERRCRIADAGSLVIFIFLILFRFRSRRESLSTLPRAK